VGVPYGSIITWFQSKVKLLLAFVLFVVIELAEIATHKLFAGFAVIAKLQFFTANVLLG
jgi:hypothetical protein